MTKYNLNKDYFNSIDTEHKAYWLGYILADGHVMHKKTEANRRYYLMIQSIDEWFCNNIKLALNSTHPVKTVGKGGFEGSKTNYRITFTSKALAAVLITYKEAMTIPSIDSSLIHHFVRGFFDGDGSVYTYNKKCKTKSYPWLECSMIANSTMQTALVNTLTAAGIKSRIKKSKTAWMNYVVVSNKADNKLFYEWLYKDATIYLPRKHNVFSNYYAP